MLRIWDLFNTINFPLCSILAASHIFQYVAFSLGSKCFLSFLMASPLTRRLFINTLSFKPSAGWSSPFKAFAVLVEFSTARSSKWALALLVLILEAARGASSDTQGARNSVFGCFFFFSVLSRQAPGSPRVAAAGLAGTYDREGGERPLPPEEPGCHESEEGPRRLFP